jgi:hypothetical protein
VPLPLSGTQIDKLGRRLRDADQVSEQDLTSLQELLLSYETVLDGVAGELREIGLRPTTRLKTSRTIIEKLQREKPITLRSIHDLAGARVVQPMTLSRQNLLADRVLTLWPDARVIDRRANPSFGYRAVHIIPRIETCFVEIQLRTLYQDTWAQFTEALGDAWGRAIRYGDPPEDPDRVPGGDSLTRRAIVEMWLGMSPQIAELEELEDARDRLADAMEDEERERLDTDIEAGFGDLRRMLRDLRADLP